MSEIREALPRTSTTDAFDIYDEAIVDIEEDPKRKLQPSSSISTTIEDTPRMHGNCFDELVAESSQET